MAFHPPRLGPGAVYLRSLDAVFRSHADLIRVAEIEPQTLWTRGTAAGALPRGSPAELQHIASLPQRVLTHGVGCPIGGVHCDERQAPLFRAWNDALQVPWTSEHLSIFRVQGARGQQPCGFLMPPLQTEAGAQLAAANIARRRHALGLSFAFETGVNYFVPRAGEMQDGEFFASIAELADCGILLDLANLWANEQNGRAKISEVLDALPLDRVWEVHLAGLEYAHGHWLDAHAGAIDDELIAIAGEAVARLPNLGAITFEVSSDRLAAFGERGVLLQMERLHQLWEKNRLATPAEPRTRPGQFDAFMPTPEAWEQLIASRMLPEDTRPSSGEAQALLRDEDDRSFALYSVLAGSFRSGAVAELLEHTTRLLLLGLGESALRDLMDRYIAATPPVAFPTDEAISFKRYLEANPVRVPGLEDLLRFEAALIDAAANDDPVQVQVSTDIDALLAELAMGRLPGPACDRSPTVLEVGVAPQPYVRAMSLR